MDRYLVINSDGHAGLPPERYRDYLDPQYRDEFDRQHIVRMAALAQSSELLEMSQQSAKWASDKLHGLEGAWDSDRRNEVLDADGVVAEILYVDGLTERNSPPFGGDLGLLPMGADPELQWAGARSHNRWLTEFVSLAPERRFGLALIPPFWDVDESVKEIESARKQGLRGIMLPHLWGDQDPYHHPRFDPMWAACQDNDMIVHFHCGAGPMKDYFGTELFGQQPGEEPPAHLPGGLGIYVTEIAFWLVRPVVFMIWGGVLERYPRLKVVVAEGTSIWAPELLAVMDQRYSDHHFTAKLGSGYTQHIPMKPSEYFHRNVRIGSSCMSRHEAEMSHEIGVKSIMWGTDYPHPEGTWPYTRKLMIETFHGMPENEIEAMLGGNAVEFYGLDVDKLNPLAERIGPERSWFREKAA